MCVVCQLCCLCSLTFTFVYQNVVPPCCGVSHERGLGYFLLVVVADLSSFVGYCDRNRIFTSASNNKWAICCGRVLLTGYKYKFPCENWTGVFRCQKCYCSNKNQQAFLSATNCDRERQAILENVACRLRKWKRTRPWLESQ